MNRLEHALALARQGLLILPIMPGTKLPYLKESWSAIMTTNEETIRGWFAERPDMNYAVCPGQHAVILDPDIDATKGKNGLAALRDLETENFEDPITGQTLTVKSPRGGNHIYLKSPIASSNSSAGFADGIDVRGFGGYVLGPGSHTVADGKTTAEGTYEIICDMPLMDAPQWVVDRLSDGLAKSEGAQEPPPQGWDTDYALEAARQVIRAQSHWPVEGHNGDDQTYAFIACLRDYGVSAERVVELLNEPYGEDEESWNARCEPSWSDEELERKAANVYKYGAFRPGLRGGIIMMLEGEIEAQVERAVAAEAEVRTSALDALAFTASGFHDRNVKQDFIIREWLLAHGMTAFLAKRGTGKTVAMADMAWCIASDMDWHGIPVKKNCAVVYLCGEDDIGLQQHFKAWCKSNHIPPEDRLLIMVNTPNLMNGAEVGEWATYIRKRLGPDRIIVTFVDTWQRATSSASQNDDKEMQNAAANGEALARALRGPCVIAFHPPKNNPDTLMGSSIIENMTVGIWTMKMDGDNFHRVMRVARLKGKGERNEVKFEYKEVGLGEFDDFEKEYTGLIVLRQGGTAGGDTPDYSEAAHAARFWYATVIGRLLVDYKNEGGKPKNGDFSVVDTARRIKEFLNSHDADAKRYKLQLADAKDAGYVGEADSFKRHLAKLFIENTQPQITETELFVSVDGTNPTSKKFHFDDAAMARAEKARKLKAAAPLEDDEDF